MRPLRRTLGAGKRRARADWRFRLYARLRAGLRLGGGIVLVATLLLAACGGGNGASDGPTTLPASLGVPGLTVFTNSDDLFVDEGGGVRLLRAAPDAAGILSPALSPRGDAVLYVLLDQSGAGGRDRSALHLITLDGVDRVLREPGGAGEFFLTPRWHPDGDAVLYTHETAHAGDADNTSVQSRQAVEFLNLENGSISVLRNDARDGAFSADGTQVALVDAPFGDERITIINVETRTVRTLVDQTSGLSAFRIPRFEPGGNRLAFSASGTGPAVTALPRALAASVRNGVQDLWLVDGAGGTPRRLTTVLEDLPDYAWAGDGRAILMRGAFGVYLVDVAAGTTQTLRPGETHGGHDWRGRADPAGTASPPPRPRGSA